MSDTDFAKDLEHVLSTDPGRRFIASLLRRHCGLESDLLAVGPDGFKQQGRRGLAVSLNALAFKQCPDLWRRMRAEADARQIQEAEAMAQEKRT